MPSHEAKGRTMRTAATVAVAAVLLLAGCKHDGPPQWPFGMPDVDKTVGAWCGYIEQAGLPEYAAYGRKLLAKNKVKFVWGGALDDRFNAVNWPGDNEIWINKPMFARYPDPHDQGEIFLHELIHLRTGIQVHEGEWWEPLYVYRNYWQGK